MRRPLVVVAAGGLGREVAEAAWAGDEWEPVGFVDDDPARWGTDVDGIPVLGPPESALRQVGAGVVLGAGSGAARLALRDRLVAAGLPDDRWATVRAPGVGVPRSSVVGAGSVLLAGTVLTAGVRVGPHVVCMPGVVLTHDDQVEPGVTLCAGVTLGGGVVVRTGAYLGMRAAVRENGSVGAGAVVGMGSVVLGDVPAGEVWVGTPARFLRPVAAPTPAGVPEVAR